MECNKLTKEGYSLTQQDILQLLKCAFEKAGYNPESEIDLREYRGYWDFAGGGLFDIHSDPMQNKGIGDLSWDIYTLCDDLENGPSDPSYLFRTVSMVLYAISLKGHLSAE
ncbi:MAG: hypothetical protein KDE03_02365 [Rhodobacteraceae bacterium]|nr:hypothetical protein [Paracoccaceae bacterium]